MSTSKRQRGRFSILLGALLFFLIALPFVDGGTLPWVVRAGFTVVPLAGLYVAAGRRTASRVALFLVVPAIAIQWTSRLLGTPEFEEARLAMSAIFLIFTAGVVLQFLFREERVTADTILGGINVYLLLGIAYAVLHALVETVTPGSYTVGGVGVTELLNQAGSEGFSELVYFSFVTFTTLGYGDMVPANSISGMLSASEAVVGQLYVAIFVARLVSLQVSQAAQTRSEPRLT